MVNLVLTRLVTTSTTQDKYGQVDVNVVLVLQGLLRVHAAIEGYIKAKQGSSQLLSAPFLHSDRVAPILQRFATKDTLWSVLRDLYNVNMVVESSIYQILKVYYTFIGQFKFDTEYVERMQRFVDYQV